METSLWMLVVRDGERRGPCPAVGFIPDSCELFLRDAGCLCRPHRQQECSSFSLFNRHGLCCQKIHHQLLTPPPLLSLCLAAAAPLQFSFLLTAAPVQFGLPTYSVVLHMKGKEPGHSIQSSVNLQVSGIKLRVAGIAK